MSCWLEPLNCSLVPPHAIARTHHVTKVWRLHALRRVRWANCIFFQDHLIIVKKQTSKKKIKIRRASLSLSVSPFFFNNTTQQVWAHAAHASGVIIILTTLLPKNGIRNKERIKKGKKKQPGYCLGSILICETSLVWKWNQFDCADFAAQRRNKQFDLGKLEEFSSSSSSSFSRTIFSTLITKKKWRNLMACVWYHRWCAVNLLAGRNWPLRGAARAIRARTIM